MAALNAFGDESQSSKILSQFQRRKEEPCGKPDLDALNPPNPVEIQLIHKWYEKREATASVLVIRESVCLLLVLHLTATHLLGL